MFKKMPFILIAVIAAVVLLAPYMPLEAKQAIYAVSLTIKSAIVFLLPLIIFGLLFKAAIMLSSSASKIIGMILAFVCLSNFLSTMLSRFVGKWVYNLELSMIVPKESEGLSALWQLELPKLIPNDVAMFAGIILGLVASKLYNEQARKLARSLEMFIGHVLQGIVYLIPFFVSGFVVKLQYDEVVGVIVRDYTTIFAVIAAAQFGYILINYFLLNNMALRGFIKSVKNMLPAAISGFSTMSSAASMPLSIIGVERNSKNKDVAASVVPATVNIHLVGDCFAIPIFAYAVLKSYGMAEPSLINYLIFAFYFVLAKFSVAAIPGGGILVMLPVLESYLGFNADMMSLITALYILFDPVITSANVLGNGAFAQLIDRCVSMVKRVHA